MIVTVEEAVRVSHERFMESIEEDRFYLVSVNNQPGKKMLGCDLQLSSIMWNIYRKHTSIPLSDTLMIEPEDCFTDKIMRAMFYAIIQPTIMDPKVDKEELWRTCYIAYNDLYNFAVTTLLKYVDSIDVYACMELLNDPDLRAMNEKIQTGEMPIEAGYKLLGELLRGEKHRDNPIARARTYGTVPLPQLNQSFVAIGQTTDIDSVVYVNEITRGFAMGYGDINSLAKASRSAAKALLFNKDPVAAAEYLNRKMQLVGNNIRKIHQFHDCGTTDFHTVVMPEDQNTFEKYEGVSQVLPDGGTRPIEITDTHLKGKRINIRTTMCCRELAHQGVCSVCYGNFAYSLIDTANPGHVSTTAICGPATQKVISTKHLDFIRCIINLVLPPEDAKYLELHRSLDSLKLKDKHKGKKLQLQLDGEESKGLINLVYMTNIDGINLTHVSSLTGCDFVTVDDDGYATDVTGATLTRQATNAALSLSMLKYIKTHGWTTIGKRISIDLSNWDFSKPIFTYQLKHENMSAYVSRVELFIRSTLRDEQNKRDRRSRMMRLTRFNDPTEALLAGLQLMTEKLDVNVAHIATVLAASRVMDPDNGDWRIANGLHVGKFVSHDEILQHWDIATAVLYEEQFKVFSNPSSYLERDRIASPLQPLILPK